MQSRGAAKPFVMWLGGKAQLLERIRGYYPFKDGKTVKYAEPFVGGGAVLFDILNNYDLEEVYISDVNAELINTYQAVRDNANELIELLQGIEAAYLPKSAEQRKEIYLSARTVFNATKLDGAKTNVQKAAAMLFLNRTGFCAMYRVNKKGEYNTPVGKLNLNRLFDTDNIRLASEKLQRVQIKCADYKESASFIDSRTFVYFDPPYRRVTPEKPSFLRYTPVTFQEKEQQELAEFITQQCAKGAKLLVSNSDPAGTDETDNYFESLCAAANVERVETSRSVSGSYARRSKAHELLLSFA